MVFLLLLTISLYWINQVLKPKYIYKNSSWPTTSTYNQFYKMKENSIDVLFLGSSVAVNGFSPQEIYNTYGIRSYNLGSEQQSIFLSYYWLKEALRFQSPKAVVLDTKFLFQRHPENPINTSEGLTRKCLDPMKWSKVKAEAVSALCRLDETQSELSYYFTNIRFHSRWSYLNETDVLTGESQYAELKGYSALESYGSETFETYTSGGDGETMASAPAVMKESLDKITALCKEQGISLILVSLPGNAMNDGVHNMLTAYSLENQVDYYNFCEKEMYESIGAKLPRENVVGHENLWGSIKMSNFMGAMLRDSYGIPSVEDEQYEETKAFYEHIKKNCELSHVSDILDYLKLIRDDQYTVFLSVRNDASTGLTEEITQQLQTLGLVQDLTGKYQWSYCAVVPPETSVREELSPEKVTMTGSIRGGKTLYTLSSAGYPSGASSSIVIDGVEYSMDCNGINLAVYDNTLMKVVDKVCFHTSGAAFR